MAKTKFSKIPAKNRGSSGDDSSVGAKNANGEGSFFKTVTRERTHWRGYLYASDRQPIRVCSVEHRTRAIARAAAEAKLAEYETAKIGRACASDTGTSQIARVSESEVLSTWCAKNDQFKQLVGSTERRYARFQQLMLDERYGVSIGRRRVPIGTLALEEINQAMVREWLGQVSVHEGDNKVTNLRLYLSEHLEIAHNSGIIKGNPAKYRQRHDPVDLEPTHVAELLLGQVDDSARFRTLLDACTNASVAAALILMAYGVRWSEILGLTWDRLRGDTRIFIGQQLKHCHIVRNGLRDAKRTYALGPRKAGARGYWIELSEAEHKILVEAADKAHDVEVDVVNSKERFRGRRRVRFVVCNREGGRYAEQTLRRHIRELEAKVNAPYQNPHAYRHDMVSFAATEEANGLPGAAASVGHRELNTTVDYVDEQKRTQVALRVHRERSRQLGFVD